MNQKENLLLEILQQLVETGTAKIDLDALALLDESLKNKIFEIKQKIQMYLGDSPDMILERYKIISEHFPEFKEKLKESDIIKIALLSKNLQIKIYASGEFIIKSIDGKFAYKRKLKDISKYIASLQKHLEDPKKEVKLLFTKEELYHLLSVSDVLSDNFDVIRINNIIVDLVMNKIKNKEILPFKKEDDEIAFDYFIFALKTKLQEKQIFLWQHREKVLNDLNEDPEFTIFYDKEKKALYIPTSFIRFIIERNPKMILSVFHYFGIKDIAKFRTSYITHTSLYNEKKDVYYYIIPIKRLNEILQKLGYEPLEINYVTEKELEEKLAKLKEQMAEELVEYKK